MSRSHVAFVALLLLISLVRSFLCLHFCSYQGTASHWPCEWPLLKRDSISPPQPQNVRLLQFLLNYYNASSTSVRFSSSLFLTSVFLFIHLARLAPMENSDLRQLKQSRLSKRRRGWRVMDLSGVGPGLPFSQVSCTTTTAILSRSNFQRHQPYRVRWFAFRYRGWAWLLRLSGPWIIVGWHVAVHSRCFFRFSSSLIIQSFRRRLIYLLMELSGQIRGTSSSVAVVSVNRSLA